MDTLVKQFKEEIDNNEVIFDMKIQYQNLREFYEFLEKEQKPYRVLEKSKWYRKLHSSENGGYLPTDLITLSFKKDTCYRTSVWK